jgi:hypothetical protein
MLNSYSTEYSERRDDELLLLASDRASLTTEARAALDAELRRRNLTKSDQAKHQQFVKRNMQREARKHRRKIFGTRRDRGSWLDLFWAIAAMSLISFTYLALPSRYHMKPDWQEAAEHMMFASVFIAVVGRSWWRKIAEDVVSPVVCHPPFRCPCLDTAGWNSQARAGKQAILLGFVLFFAVYGFVWLLRRNFYGIEAREPHIQRRLGS